ncbi:DUF6296 family protein [Kitasatospora sp. NPDC057015]|uniref:DUF6296 family protein n=1 Tax=Kitasatospora sp. NPDC057015 TaxID=3346001 RepID=UPI00362B6337
MSNHRYDDDRFELVFATPTSGGTPDVVVVRRSTRRGAGGHPVYLDTTGIVCAEISDRGEARMLATGPHQLPAPPVRVRRIAPTAPQQGPGREHARRQAAEPARPALRETPANLPEVAATR